MKVSIEVDYNMFLKGLEQSIQIRVGDTDPQNITDTKKVIIRVEEEEDGS